MQQIFLSEEEQYFILYCILYFTFIYIIRIIISLLKIMIFLLDIKAQRWHNLHTMRYQNK